MKTLYRISILIILVCATAFHSRAFTLPSDDAIDKALASQISRYPKAQLADIYKNFFQDYFGPGHILSDKAKSKAYLDSELAEGAPYEGPDYELTGADGNFVRVNLSVIGEGKVTYDDYLSLFFESISGIVPPTPDQWRETWQHIDNRIQLHGYHFTNEKDDRRMIEDKMRNGDFVVHHSDIYNATYHFRYRIFSRPLFEAHILPLLNTEKPEDS